MRVLYEHFRDSGQTERAEEILKIYPQFKDAAPKKEKVKKE